jgi:hypothetical protein
VRSNKIVYFRFVQLHPCYLAAVSKVNEAFRSKPVPAIQAHFNFLRNCND